MLAGIFYAYVLFSEAGWGGVREAIRENPFWTGVVVVCSLGVVLFQSASANVVVLLAFIARAFRISSAPDMPATEFWASILSPSSTAKAPASRDPKTSAPAMHRFELDDSEPESDDDEVDAHDDDYLNSLAAAIPDRKLRDRAIKHAQKLEQHIQGHIDSLPQRSSAAYYDNDDADTWVGDFHQKRPFAEAHISAVGNYFRGVGEHVKEKWGAAHTTELTRRLKALQSELQTALCSKLAVAVGGEASTFGEAKWDVLRYGSKDAPSTSIAFSGKDMRGFSAPLSVRTGQGCVFKKGRFQLEALSKADKPFPDAIGTWSDSQPQGRFTFFEHRCGDDGKAQTYVLGWAEYRDGAYSPGTSRFPSKMTRCTPATLEGYVPGRGEQYEQPPECVIM